MARSGEVVENPIIGDRVTWRKTAQETHGELLQYELVVWPAAKGPLAHIHPRQEERFEVLSGTLRARVGDSEEQTLSVGARAWSLRLAHPIPGGTTAMMRLMFWLSSARRYTSRPSWKLATGSPVMARPTKKVCPTLCS